VIDPSDHADYADGPPPQPWSRETIFLAVGFGILAAFFAFVIACRAQLGPTGNLVKKGVVGFGLGFANVPDYAPIPTAVG
jgi:hypothetical protein